MSECDSVSTLERQLDDWFCRRSVDHMRGECEIWLSGSARSRVENGWAGLGPVPLLLGKFGWPQATALTNTFNWLFAGHFKLRRKNHLWQRVSRKNRSMTIFIREVEWLTERVLDMENTSSVWQYHNLQSAVSLQFQTCSPRGGEKSYNIIPEFRKIDGKKRLLFGISRLSHLTSRSKLLVRIIAC